ncbi:MAG: CobD/CbiB family cobalamin biosynthesis protein [Bilophila wadsworthia]
MVLSAIIIWICVAPRSLDEHALRVAVPLAKGDLEGARKAVSMMVGRNPDRLDAHGVARACVESVGENLTDGILSTLFWAGIGLFFFGYPGAACLAVLHRSANVLDALWGKKNEKYIRFGTFAARLDDALNFVPARLFCPASRSPPASSRTCGTTTSFRGLEIPHGPRKPNSAWSGGLCRSPRPQARRPRRVRGSVRRPSVARRRNPRCQARAHRAGSPAHVAFRYRLHAV